MFDLEFRQPAGFRLVSEATFLPYQYCLVLRPR